MGVMEAGAGTSAVRVYLAADFARATEVEGLGRLVEEPGRVKVVSRWHSTQDEEEVVAAGRVGGPSDSTAAARSAARNIEDVRRCDIFVLLATGERARGGRHFETGFALAIGKRVVIAGPVEHVFHRLPGVEHTTVAELPAVISRLAGDEMTRADDAGPAVGPGAKAAACLRAQGIAVPGSPTVEVEPHLHDLWPRLLREELDEFVLALGRRDLVEVADALADIVYVAYSAGASYGIPMDEVFDEVHRSNLSKVPRDGPMERRADGKTLKPPGFSPPDLERILRRS